MSAKKEAKYYYVYYIEKKNNQDCRVLHDLICLASVAHAVIQSIGRTELEDSMRLGGRLKRLHAHCGVCTSPTVMLNPL